MINHCIITNIYSNERILNDLEKYMQAKQQKKDVDL